MACPKVKSQGRVLSTWKNFFARERIGVKLLILHSTESGPGSGRNIAHYLAESPKADVHVVIDTDGSRYRLVRDGQKAWHVGNANGYTLGIEMVGRAAQTTWPQAQVEAVARQLATWSNKYNIPLRSAGVTRNRWNGNRGVAYHRTVSGPGGHWDPGYHFPLWKCLRLARKYRKACYGR